MKSYYKGENLQQLIGFCNVVQYGSVAKAADVMGVVHSAVSKQINSLEASLKRRLFNRTGNRVVLNDDGREFYEMAIDLVNQFRHLNDKFFEKQNQKNNIVRIAAHHYILSDVLPPIIRNLKDTNPEYTNKRFELNAYTRAQAIEALKKGDVDFIIYPIALGEIEEDVNIKYEKLFLYKPVLVLWKGHPLENAKDDEIDTSLLFQQHMILAINDFVSTKFLKNMAIKFDTDGTIVARSTNLDIIIQCIKNKLGVMIMHEEFVKRYDGLTLKKASHFPQTYFILGYLQNDHSEKYSTIFQAIKSCFKQ